MVTTKIKATANNELIAWKELTSRYLLPKDAGQLSITA